VGGRRHQQENHPDQETLNVKLVISLSFGALLSATKRSRTGGAPGLLEQPLARYSRAQRQHGGGFRWFRTIQFTYETPVTDSPIPSNPKWYFLLVASGLFGREPANIAVQNVDLTATHPGRLGRPGAVQSYGDLPTSAPVLVGGIAPAYRRR
jgi:hypothetical protein